MTTKRRRKCYTLSITGLATGIVTEAMSILNSKARVKHITIVIGHSFLTITWDDEMPSWNSMDYDFQI